jgi:probable F420-dependent oxidoreductase
MPSPDHSSKNVTMMDLGDVGIWTAQLDFVSAAELRDIVQELEDLGFRSLWLGENVGREPIAQAGIVLAATQRLVVATAVLNIWARDPLATVAAQLTLAEAYPGRFLLGVGASHALLVEDQRGHHYHKPLAKMRDYLGAMDRAATRYRAPRPGVAPRLLGALGPKMLALAAEQADGAHTYFVPPEHTAQARSILGRDKLLAVEQAVVLETDPATARAIGRRHTRRLLPLVNYTDNLRRLGFVDSDLDGEGSDRLVDALVAWGDLDAIVRRVDEHRQAGSDHVCLQVIDRDFRTPPRRAWSELARAFCP